MTTSAMTSPALNALLDDLVRTMASMEQTINQLTAVKTAMLATAARIADDEPFDSVDSREMAHRAVATELAAALRVSDRTVESQMDDAVLLVTDFPQTAAAFYRGAVSHAHVRIILAAGHAIESAEGRERFESIVLPRAEAESPNRFRPFAKQTAERLREVSFTERHREARENRGVWMRDHEDGMAELVQYGPTALIRAEHDRLTQMAFEVKQENARLGKAMAEDDFADQRTMNQLRCDLLADLVLTATPTGHLGADGLLGEIRAHIDITVPALTLTDPDELAAPAHLEGVGPVDPETARILVGHAPGFDRVLTDPVSGSVLGVDRYRPSAEMRRYLRARDRRCRFPGCRMLARMCDGDHTVDHAHGGPTEIGNLADFCRRHHVTKHNTPWRVRQLGGGILEWTSPTGRIHVDRPPGVATHVTFEDVEERMPVPAPF
ncbi:HNH endonuclease signature motif containing protein [Microbacterium aerolatum]|nr:HNH endonuclease signature motif containing protein [Microbacterium aerolatum]